MCSTLCDLCNPPGSAVHGMFQARILEMGLPFPSPGIEPASSVLAGGFFTTEPPEKSHRENCFTSFEDLSIRSLIG